MTRSEILEKISHYSGLKTEVDNKRIRLNIAIGNLHTLKVHTDQQRASAIYKHTGLGGFIGNNANRYSECVNTLTEGISKYSDDVGIVIEDYNRKMTELLEQSVRYQSIIDSFVGMLALATD